VIDGGRIVATGTPDDVLGPELCAEVFDVAVSRLRHPLTGGLLLAVAPLG
jgi:iron complex transport system ATP-binding protein